MAGGNVPSNLAPLFQQAGQQYHIPANVLAGVASVETNLGANRSVSSAGAQGLMQFMPGTATALGVNPHDDRSSIFGAAKLLNQYGYQSNPLRALGAYNGGPGNPQYGYAHTVMSEAQRLAGQLGSSASLPGPTPSIGTSVPGASPSPGGGIDQGAFQKAQAANIAGNYLRGNAKSAFDMGAPKTGLEGGGNPLIGPGLLTAGAAPKASDFASAQSALQSLAGGQGLNPHPAIMGAAQGGALAGGGQGLQAVISAANSISANHYNYEWGGGHNAQFAPAHGTGHGSGPGTGYDCSGAISAILHSVGILGSPLVAQGFMSFGKPGPGGPGDVTIYASPTHVFAQIGGKFFGTSGSNPGGGAGWFASANTSGFTVRHVTP